MYLNLTASSTLQQNIPHCRQSTDYDINLFAYDIWDRIWHRKRLVNCTMNILFRDTHLKTVIIIANMYIYANKYDSFKFTASHRSSYEWITTTNDKIRLAK